jgi:tetratricopeptide (TPR) repeat protein
MKNALIFVLMIAFIAVLALRERRDATDTPAGSPSVASDDPRRWSAFDLHRSGRQDKAILAYDALLLDNPRDAEILYYRGIAHWDLAQYLRAEEDFRALVVLDPGHFKAHQHLDQLLSRTRRYDECIALWTGYTRILPGDPEGHYLRGWARLRSGDDPGAHADVARACELGKAEACRRAESLAERVKEGRPQR